tara:strand:+ start:1355 stop:1729 length:375 start_codon:yes stop_codon:yes gene_type:complete
MGRQTLDDLQAKPIPPNTLAENHEPCPRHFENEGIRKRNNMNKHNSRWTEADEKQMLHLHAQSKSPAEMSKVMGRTSKAIALRLSQKNLKPYRNPKQSAKYTKYTNVPRKTVKWFWGALEITKF